MSYPARAEGLVNMVIQRRMNLGSVEQFINQENSIKDDEMNVLSIHEEDIEAAKQN